MTDKMGGIIRWLYEVGMCSEEFLIKIFYKEDQTNKKEIIVGSENKEGETGGGGVREKENENGDENAKEENIKTGDNETEIAEEIGDRKEAGEAVGTGGKDEGHGKRKNSSKKNFRAKHIGPLIENGMVGFIDVHKQGQFRPNRHYILKHKGYDFARRRMAGISEISIMIKNFKRLTVIKGLDTGNVYRYVASAKVNDLEAEHHDGLVRMKYVIQIALNKQVMIHDILSSDNELFVKRRTDLLIHRGENKYTAIEYERSVKSRKEYLGYSMTVGGKLFTNQGFIKARQADDFLPKGHAVDRFIIVCENKTILNEVLKNIHALSVLDSRGKYTIVNKFYLINKEEYPMYKDMVLKGACLYCRKQPTNNGLDYVHIPFKDLILKEGPLV